jgi:hypothetical protein
MLAITLWHVCWQSEWGSQQREPLQGNSKVTTSEPMFSMLSATLSHSNRYACNNRRIGKAKLSVGPCKGHICRIERQLSQREAKPIRKRQIHPFVGGCCMRTMTPKVQLQKKIIASLKGLGTKINWFAVNRQRKVI